MDQTYIEEQTESKGPVECMGITFKNDEERRDYFIEKLRKKLKDPTFRKIEGFPIGEDDAILSLSDPPFYTACPNPFIADFIKYYGKPYNQEDAYSREPFASDVSEGKNDPIYNAHSYHTKVPYKALLRYVLHYTTPGDLIFDGFCGTGMTGIAAHLAGDRDAVSELGLRVDTKGNVIENGNAKLTKVGQRHTVLSDLSPFASFVASKYGVLSEMSSFADEALRIIGKVEKEVSWLYECKEGTVLSAIWSDVFLCPECGGEMVFWEISLKNEEMQQSFPCPHCGAIVGKSASKSTGATKLERPFDTKFDPILQKVVRIPKFVLVEQTVSTTAGRQAIAVSPATQKALQDKLTKHSWPVVPSDEFFPGRQTNKLINGSGILYVSHMYTPRCLFAYATLWQQEFKRHLHTDLFRFCLSSINNYVSRKQGYFGGGGGVSGTLFTPSIHLERNVFDVLRRKLKKLRALTLRGKATSCVSTQSVADLKNIPSNSIDYVFTDPPFGESLQYAELNMFVEAWMKVKTAKQDDCVLNYVHGKDLAFYGRLMTKAFGEYARVLVLPGSWGESGLAVFGIEVKPAEMEEEVSLEAFA